MQNYRKRLSMQSTKEDIRIECLAKLRKSGLSNKHYRDALINKQLLRFFQGMEGLNILFYWPLNLEADIKKSLHVISKKNNVYLPFMEEISFKMVPYRLPLRRKKFNIYEAGNSIKNIRKIDVAIIPVVGVDIKSRRIGFGRGMYDRFFAKLKNDPYKIFVQSQICYTQKDICDDYDVACDMLITPKVRILHRRKRDANFHIAHGFYSRAKRGSRFFHF